MIAGQEFWRPPRIFAALTITPAFFFVVRGLSAIIFRNRIEHKTATLLIRQDPAFTAYAFGHQNSHHTRGPDHAGGMKLHELHVDQIRTCLISKRVTVASVLPTVAGNLVRPSNSASGQHHRFGAKNLEASTFAFVTKCSDHAVAIFEERKNGVLHIDVDALVHAVILQSPNHLQTRAIAHVGQSWIFMPAEMSLQNASVFGAIKYGAPCVKLSNAIRRFFRVHLRHSPLIYVLPT